MWKDILIITENYFTMTKRIHYNSILDYYVVKYEHNDFEIFFEKEHLSVLLYHQSVK